MDYLEALDHLDGLINYEVQPRAGAVKGLSLDKMQQVMEILGDPQHSCPAIHITGTNGKGSTARMIESLLTSKGLRVGLYTSPHVSSPCERIRVGAAELDQPAFGQAVGDIARLVEAADLEPLSWFETVTAAALLHFANEAVEVAVVEVGMLGRFDATNVVDGQVAVVTNVGRDHTDGAPGWWQRIAEEKVGIVKPGARVVLGETTPELLDLVAAQSPEVINTLTTTPASSDRGSGDISASSDRGSGYARQQKSEHTLLSNEVAVGGRLLSVQTPRATYSEVFVGLHGAHQGHNAAVAIAAVEEFFDAPLNSEVLQEALASVEAPGRLEVVHRSPLMLLDAAHNPPGAEVLAKSLDEDFAGVDRRFLVFGMQDGRDPAEVLEALDLASIDLVVACTAPTARGVEATALCDAALSSGARAEAIADIATAIDYVLDQAGDEDLIVVAGSVTVLEVARELAAEL
ncbi:MAG: Mur ligase family protein [Acidimicrobiaceae bacterium]|nr:Mur ligase family protein [Acidimicrobiaceae bacterium]